MKKRFFKLLNVLLLGIGLFNTAYAEDKTMTLTHRQQALAEIGLLTAAGNQPALKIALTNAFEQGLSINEAKDAMVQLYAYAGFPRSLNALTTLAETVKSRQAQGLKTETGRTATKLPNDVDMLKLGSQTQTDLIGQKVDLSALSRY